ncbi:MAG: substrate-binding domain-containing protein [Anaeroplasmataceae bacterium]|nr:substrate-binding domain-containing protein [Anaeroplasmataceae bacterium]
MKGFDNLTEAYSLSPSLTTFSLDKHFLGSEILRTLITRIENKNIPSRFITISTNLISRESTNQ